MQILNRYKRGIALILAAAMALMSPLSSMAETGVTDIDPAGAIEALLPEREYTNGTPLATYQAEPEYSEEETAPVTTESPEEASVSEIQNDADEQVSVSDSTVSEQGFFACSDPVDGVVVTVKAKEGVFPAGAKLVVKKLASESSAAEDAEAAVDNTKLLDEEDKENEDTETQRYLFDITIVDADGNEIQPDGEVEVKFAFADEVRSFSQARVFHIEDDGEKKLEKLEEIAKKIEESDDEELEFPDGEIFDDVTKKVSKKTAREATEELDAIAETIENGEASDELAIKETPYVAQELEVAQNDNPEVEGAKIELSVVTDSFSTYVIEFSYSNLTYSISGNSFSVKDVLKEMNITDPSGITDVRSSLTDINPGGTAVSSSGSGADTTYTVGENFISGKLTVQYTDERGEEHTVEISITRNNFVACIDSRNYASLQEALNAVRPGETIEITSNIILTDTAAMKKSYDDAQGIWGRYHSIVTIDLNGYEIKGELNDKPVILFEGVNVTIKDSSEDSSGRIENTSLSPASNVVTFSDGWIRWCQCTLAGGTYAGQNVIFNDAVDFYISTSGNSKVNLLAADGGYALNETTLPSNFYVDGNNILIDGKLIYPAEDIHYWKLSGGTYTDTLKPWMVKDGSKAPFESWDESGNIIYTVEPASKAAAKNMYTGLEYHSLEAAIDLAAEGDLISLQKDDLSGDFPIAKTVSVDLNRKKLSGTVTATSGNVKFMNGDLKGSLVASGDSTDVIIPAINMESGSISAKDGAKISISGGIYGSVTFSESNGSIEISGGQFAKEISPEYIAPGYMAIKEGDYWTVTSAEGNEAVLADEIHGVKDYGTLPAMIATASDGDIVVIVTNALGEESINADNGKDFSIDLYGKTIKKNLVISDNTKLYLTDGTLDGSITVADGSKLFIDNEMFVKVTNNLTVSGTATLSNANAYFDGTITGDGDVQISAGYFKYEPDDKYLAEGYKAVKVRKEDKYYTIVPVTVKVTTTSGTVSYFEDLQTAAKLMNASSEYNGATIELLKDVTDHVVFRKENGINNEYILSLGNYSLRATEGEYALGVVGAKVMLESGTIYGSETASGAIAIEKYGTLIIPKNSDIKINGKMLSLDLTIGMSISGGYYADPPKNNLESGFAVFLDSKYKEFPYAVKRISKNAAAYNKQKNTYYVSLKDAVSDAGSNQTISLFKSVYDAEEKAEVKESITFDFGSFVFANGNIKVSESGHLDIVSGSYKNITVSEGKDRITVKAGLFDNTSRNSFADSLDSGLSFISNTDAATKTDFPWTVGTAEVSIIRGSTTIEYTSISDAVNDMSGGDELRLLKDITLENGKHLDFNRVPAYTTISLNLNGHTLSGQFDNGGLLTFNMLHVNISDSTGTGKIWNKSTSGNSYAIYSTSGSYVKMRIYGGIIEGANAIYLYESDVFINEARAAVSVLADNADGYAILFNSPSAEINIADSGSYIPKIKGNIEYKTIPDNANLYYRIQGGMFTNRIRDNYLYRYYEYTKREYSERQYRVFFNPDDNTAAEYPYTVYSATRAKAELVNTTQNKDIAAETVSIAAKHAESGDTIRILQEVTDNSVEISANVTLETSGNGKLGGKLKAKGSDAVINISAGKYSNLTFSTEDGGSVNITGGWYNSVLSTGEDETAGISITGGFFSEAPDSECIPDGYKRVNIDEGIYKYTVKKLDDIEAYVKKQSGEEQYYCTLTQAISAADNNDTVHLLKDGITISNGDIPGTEKAQFTKDITLDLNGKTLLVHESGNITVKDYLIIKNGTVNSAVYDVDNKQDSMFQFQGFDTHRNIITLNNVNVRGYSPICLTGNLDNCGLVINNSNDYTITAHTLIAANDSGTGKTLVINGGKFKLTSWLFDNDAIHNNYQATINGGDFTIGSWEGTRSPSDRHIDTVINAGNFNLSPDQSFITISKGSGNSIIKNWADDQTGTGDYQYTVGATSDCEAKLPKKHCIYEKEEDGGIYYLSVIDAVKEAEPGTTLTVLKDAVLSNEINFSGSIHAASGVLTITGGKYDAVFSRTQLATISITGGYYSSALSASYIADGYAVFNNPDTASIYKYIVKGVEEAEAYVEKSGTDVKIYYASLSEAVNTAPIDSKVHLLKDGIVVSNDKSRGEQLLHFSGIIINLEGHTLIVDTDHSIGLSVKSGKVTICNGTLKAQNEDVEQPTDALFRFYEPGYTLKLNNVNTVAGHIAIEACQDDKVIIDGGEHRLYTLVAANGENKNQSVEIIKGTFNLTSWMFDADDSHNYAKITVKDGNFNIGSWTGKLTSHKYSNTEIEAGNFNLSPDQEFITIPSGRKIVKNPDGSDYSFSVGNNINSEAGINGRIYNGTVKNVIHYASGPEALEDAGRQYPLYASGSEVTLEKNISIDRNIRVSREDPVTYNLNGKNVEGWKGHVSVASDSDLTVKNDILADALYFNNEDADSDKGTITFSSVDSATDISIGNHKVRISDGRWLIGENYSLTQNPDIVITGGYFSDNESKLPYVPEGYYFFTNMEKDYQTYPYIVKQGDVVAVTKNASDEIDNRFSSLSDATSAPQTAGRRVYLEKDTTESVTVNHSIELTKGSSDKVTAASGEAAFTFTAGTSTISELTVNGAVQVKNAGTVLDITSGKYESVAADDAAVIRISGGLFKNRPAETYLTSGYGVFNNKDEATREEYPYIVLNILEEAEASLLKSGETAPTYYASLSEAMSHAASGSLITLLKDDIVFSGDSEKGEIFPGLPKYANVTIDLGKNTMIIDTTAPINLGGAGVHLEIRNGNITAQDENVTKDLFVCQVGDYDLTLRDVNTTGYRILGEICQNNRLYIYGGIHNLHTFVHANKNGSGDIVDIHGGTYNLDVWRHFGDATSAYYKITVYDGNFNMGSWRDSEAENPSVNSATTIYAGNFSLSPDQEFITISSESKIVKNSDGGDYTFSVGNSIYSEAGINGRIYNGTVKNVIHYASGTEAFEDAGRQYPLYASGSEVTLERDINIDDNIHIDRNVPVTYELNGKHVDGWKGHVSVASDSDLTVKNGIIADALYFNNGDADSDKGTITFSSVDSATDISVGNHKVRISDGRWLIGENYSLAQNPDIVITGGFFSDNESKLPYVPEGYYFFTNMEEDYQTYPYIVKQGDVVAITKKASDEIDNRFMSLFDAVSAPQTAGRKVYLEKNTTESVTVNHSIELTKGSSDTVTASSSEAAFMFTAGTSTISELTVNGAVQVKNAGTVLDITSGKFESVAAYDDAVIRISGGIYSIAPSADCMENGYVVTFNDDALTKVAYPYMVVKEEGQFEAYTEKDGIAVYYASMTDALYAATETAGISTISQIAENVTVQGKGDTQGIYVPAIKLNGNTMIIASDTNLELASAATISNGTITGGSAGLSLLNINKTAGFDNVNFVNVDTPFYWRSNSKVVINGGTHSINKLISGINSIDSEELIINSGNFTLGSWFFGNGGINDHVRISLYGGNFNISPDASSIEPIKIASGSIVKNGKEATEEYPYLYSVTAPDGCEASAPGNYGNPRNTIYYRTIGTAIDDIHKTNTITLLNDAALSEAAVATCSESGKITLNLNGKTLSVYDDNRISVASGTELSVINGKLNNFYTAFVQNYKGTISFADVEFDGHLALFYPTNIYSGKWIINGVEYVPDDTTLYGGKYNIKLSVKLGAGCHIFTNTDDDYQTYPYIVKEADIVAVTKAENQTEDNWFSSLADAASAPQTTGRRVYLEKGTKEDTIEVSHSIVFAADKGDTVTASSSEAAFMFTAGTSTITGLTVNGEISAENQGTVLNIPDGKYQKVYAINGAKIVLTGGLYHIRPAETCLADGYGVFGSGDPDYPYTVRELGEALVSVSNPGESEITYYDAFTPVFSTVQNGGTVKLLKDAVFYGIGWEDKSNVTFDLDGKILTMGDSNVPVGENTVIRNGYIIQRDRTDSLFKLEGHVSKVTFENLAVSAHSLINSIPAEDSSAEVNINSDILDVDYLTFASTSETGTTNWNITRTEGSEWGDGYYSTVHWGAVDTMHSKNYLTINDGYFKSNPEEPYIKVAEGKGIVLETAEDPHEVIPDTKLYHIVPEAGYIAKVHNTLYSRISDAVSELKPYTFADGVNPQMVELLSGTDTYYFDTVLDLKGNVLDNLNYDRYENSGVYIGAADGITVTITNGDYKGAVLLATESSLTGKIAFDNATVSETEEKLLKASITDVVKDSAGGTKLEILGGVFDEDSVDPAKGNIRKYLANARDLVTAEDTRYPSKSEYIRQSYPYAVVRNDYEVRILPGNKYESTLQQAFDAFDASAGDEYIELNHNVTWASESQTASLDGNKDITLVLDGNTLRKTVNNGPAITVAFGSQLTIINSTLSEVQAVGTEGLIIAEDAIKVEGELIVPASASDVAISGMIRLGVNDGMASLSAGYYSREYIKPLVADDRTCRALGIAEYAPEGCSYVIDDAYASVYLNNSDVPYAYYVDALAASYAVHGNPWWFTDSTIKLLRDEEDVALVFRTGYPVKVDLNGHKLNNKATESDSYTIYASGEGTAVSVINSVDGAEISNKHSAEENIGNVFATFDSGSIIIDPEHALYVFGSPSETFNGTGITVKGGYYNELSVRNYLADNYSIYDNTDPETKDVYPYQVKYNVNPEAINITKDITYPTLQAALSAASDNDRIELLKNLINESETKKITISSSKKVTVNFGAFKVSNYIIEASMSQLSIEGGTFEDVEFSTKENSGIAVTDSRLDKDCTLNGSSYVIYSAFIAGSLENRIKDEFLAPDSIISRNTAPDTMEHYEYAVKPLTTETVSLWRAFWPEVYYDSFDTAVDELGKDLGIITLVKDAVMASSSEEAGIYGIDLNGHTLNVEAGKHFTTKEIVAIKDGIVNKAGEDPLFIMADMPGIASSSVAVSDTDFITEGAFARLDGRSEIIINGGTHDIRKLLVDNRQDIPEENARVLELNGGKYNIHEAGISTGSDADYKLKVVIDEGEFSLDSDYQPPFFYPEGVGQIENYSDIYPFRVCKVQEDEYDARIENLYYETLLKAISDLEAYGDNPEIVMLRDVALSGTPEVTVSVSKNTSMNLNGHRLSLAEGSFGVKQGVGLTIINGKLGNSFTLASGYNGTVVFDDSIDASETVSMSIGSHFADIRGGRWSVSEWRCASDGAFSISGGVFANDPSGMVADGYRVFDNTDPETKGEFPYMVLHMEEAEAEIISGDTVKQYVSLKDALKDARTGDTVKLLKDIATVSETLEANFNITVNMDGHSITGELDAPVLLIHDADVTVKNNGEITNISGSATASAIGAVASVKHTLSIKNGTFKGTNAIDADGYVLAISDGHFDGKISIPEDYDLEGAITGGIYTESPDSRVIAGNYAVFEYPDAAPYRYVVDRTYQVSFNLMGHGSHIDPVTVRSGYTLATPSMPEDDEYVFSGWFRDPQFIVKWNFDTDTVNEDTVLYAEWFRHEADVVRGGKTVFSGEVLQAFDYATTSDTVKIIQDSTLSQTAHTDASIITLDLDGHTVVTTDRDYLISIDNADFTVTSNNGVGRLVSMYDKPWGYVIDLSSSDESGHTFTSKNVIISGQNGIYAGIGYNIFNISNTEISAFAADRYAMSIWNNNAQLNITSGKYKGQLGYEGAGGSELGITGIKGGIYTDKYIRGWTAEGCKLLDNRDPDTRMVYPYEVRSAEGSVELNYRVVYPSGASPSDEQHKFNVAESAVIPDAARVGDPATPSSLSDKDADVGYAFDSWWTKKGESFEHQWDFENDIVMGPMDLYAKWHEIPVSSITYYDLTGTEITKNFRINTGEKLTAPADPETPGMVFDGWWTKNAKGIWESRWNFDDPVKVSVLNLYPRTKTNYTVKYDLNGQTKIMLATTSVIVVEQTIISEDKQPKVLNPEAMTQKLEGWYTKKGTSYSSADWGTKWNFSSEVVTGNMTLYAKWYPYFTFTFDKNDESAEPVFATESVAYLDKAIDKGPVTRADFRFDGWHKDRNKPSPWNFEQDTVTNDTTVYAHWIQSAASVEYNGHVYDQYTTLEAAIASASEFTGGSGSKKATVKLLSYHNGQISMDIPASAEWTLDLNGKEITAQNNPVVFVTGSGTEQVQAGSLKITDSSNGLVGGIVNTGSGNSINNNGIVRISIEKGRFKGNLGGSGYVLAGGYYSDKQNAELAANRFWISHPDEKVYKYEVSNTYKAYFKNAQTEETVLYSDLRYAVDAANNSVSGGTVGVTANAVVTDTVRFIRPVTLQLINGAKITRGVDEKAVIEADNADLTITGNGIIENTYGGVPSGADGPCAISMTSFSSRITIGNNTDTETSAGLKFYGTVKYSGQLQPADDYILNGDIFGGWFKYKPDAKMLRTGYRTYDAKPVSEGGEGGAYVFKKQFTVKYMNPEAMGGGIWQTKQVLYGDTITVESTAGWSKYLLKSWNLNGKTVYAYDSIVVTDNLTFTPNCVVAQARIGGTYYEYLQDAVNAADNKDTINLVSDCGSAVTIAGKTLTINLNNCTISGNNGYGMLNVREGAKLTVNGPGTIKNSNKSNTACAIYVDKNELIVNGCTLEGNSGIVTNPKETSTVKASSCKITGTGLNGIGTGKKSGKGFITLELINCVIVGAQAGIDLSGYEAGGKVDIKGGSIKGKDGDDDVAIIFGVAMSVVITGVICYGIYKFSGPLSAFTFGAGTVFEISKITTKVWNTFKKWLEGDGKGEGKRDPEKPKKDDPEVKLPVVFLPFFESIVMSAVPLQLVEYGKSAKKPWPDPIALNDPDHYKFNKWSQNGLTEYDFSKNKITGPTVIFGVFDEYHFASFDCLTWASSNPETQKIKSGGEIDFDKAEAQLKANMNPQYRDYVLNRWLDENGNEYPRDKDLTKDVKLHPDWNVRAEVRITTQTGPGEVRQFKSLHEAVDYANNIEQTITIETQQYAVTEVKVVLLDSFVTGDQNHPNDHPNGQAYVLNRDMTFDVNDHKLVENSTNAGPALTVESGKKVKIVGNGIIENGCSSGTAVKTMSGVKLSVSGPEISARGSQGVAISIEGDTEFSMTSGTLSSQAGGFIIRQAGNTVLTGTISNGYYGGRAAIDLENRGNFKLTGGYYSNNAKSTFYPVKDILLPDKGWRKTGPNNYPWMIGDIVTVKFEPNGGQPTPLDQKRNTGDKLDIPKDETGLEPKKEGYKLIGWFTKDGSQDGLWGDQWNFDINVVEERFISNNVMRLYARWKEIVARVDYKDRRESTLHAELQEAFNAANTVTEATVSMLRDVTVGIDDPRYDLTLMPVNTGRDITLNLNGKTVGFAHPDGDNDYDIAVAAGAKFSITDSSFADPEAPDLGKYKGSLADARISNGKGSTLKLLGGAFKKVDLTVPQQGQIVSDSDKVILDVESGVYDPISKTDIDAVKDVVKSEGKTSWELNTYPDPEYILNYPWTPCDEEDKVAKLTLTDAQEFTYSSLQAPFNDLAFRIDESKRNGAVVTLLKDTEEDISIVTTGENVLLDFEGKKLTGNVENTAPISIRSTNDAVQENVPVNIEGNITAKSVLTVASPNEISVIGDITAADAGTVNIFSPKARVKGTLSETGGRIYLRGGIYSQRVGGFCDTGYMCVPNTESETKKDYGWRVVENNPATASEAKIIKASGREIEFEKLEYALNNACEGDTVQLLLDITDERDFNVISGVVLDIAGHNLNCGHLTAFGVVKDSSFDGRGGDGLITAFGLKGTTDDYERIHLEDDGKFYGSETLRYGWLPVYDADANGYRIAAYGFQFINSKPVKKEVKNGVPRIGFGYQFQFFASWPNKLLKSGTSGLKGEALIDWECAGTKYYSPEYHHIVLREHLFEPGVALRVWYDNYQDTMVGKKIDYHGLFSSSVLQISNLKDNYWIHNEYYCGEELTN